MEDVELNSFLIVIPARGGSKGVPGKNVAKIGGIPAIGRAGMACKSAISDMRLAYDRRNSSGSMDFPSQASLSRFRAVCSTDDRHIKNHALEWGLDVIDRPAELGSDTTGTMDVIRHVINDISTSWSWDGIAVLLSLQKKIFYVVSGNMLRMGIVV